MRRFLLCFSILFIVANMAPAQNWQTVRMNDTTYFMAGKFIPGPTISTNIGVDSNLLRVIWIDSSATVANGISYRFYKTIRMTSPYIIQGTSATCMDTAAPSWLGSGFIRKADGTEYYFNGAGDTITLLTQAQTGTSWTIASSANLMFKGIITAYGTSIIDGTMDSVKTISIQAYQNNLPVYNWYNTLVLQLSKNHGWIKTIDLFRFPAVPDMWRGFGAVTDSTQHLRLPKSFSNINLDTVNNSKYAPGNEWIYCQTSGIGYTGGFVMGIDKIITHDSIISVQPASGGNLNVVYHRDVFSRTHVYSPIPDLFTDTSYSYTGNMVINGQAVSQPLSSVIHPDAKQKKLNQMVTTQDPITFRYFAETACNGQYIVKIRTAPAPMTYAAPIQGGCYKAQYGVSGYILHSTDYLTNFGVLMTMYEDGLGAGMPSSYQKNYYAYIKTATCVYGAKVPIATLGITTTDPVINKTAFSIAPNPAFNTVTINTGTTLSGTLTITDLTGRNMYRQTISASSTTIPVQDYAAGMYIVHLTTNEGTGASQKLVIAK